MKISNYNRGKPTDKGGYQYPKGQGIPRPYEKPSPEVQEELDKLKRLEHPTIASFRGKLDYGVTLEEK